MMFFSESSRNNGAGGKSRVKNRNLLLLSVRSITGATPLSWKQGFSEKKKKNNKQTNIKPFAHRFSRPFRKPQRLCLESNLR